MRDIVWFVCFLSPLAVVLVLWLVLPWQTVLTLMIGGIGGVLWSIVITLPGWDNHGSGAHVRR